MKSWTHIYTDLRPQCLRYAAALLQNKALAEDVVQDVFMHFLETQLQPGFIGNMSGFLKSAIRNKCIDQLRRSGKMVMFSQYLEIDLRDCSTEARIDFTELNKHYQQAVNRLPAKGQRVYRLKTEAGLKETQIAEQLGIGMATVTDHLKQSRAKLRAKLGALRA